MNLSLSGILFWIVLFEISYIPSLLLGKDFLKVSEKGIKEYSKHFSSSEICLFFFFNDTDCFFCNVVYYFFIDKKFIFKNEI